MKVSVNVRAPFLQCRQNLLALAEIFRANGRYLVTIHEGRIAKFTPVPPDQVVEVRDPEDGEAEE